MAAYRTEYTTIKAETGGEICTAPPPATPTSPSSGTESEGPFKKPPHEQRRY